MTINDTLADTVALMPCPFCGSSAHPEIDRASMNYIDCSNRACGVRPAAKYYDNPQHAIDAWNTRAAHDIEARVRDATEWQPIETAKKDGTPLLLAYKYPSDEAKKHIEAHHAPCKQEILQCVGRWWREAWRIGPDPMHPPSWWMPLPKPPHITDTTAETEKPS